MRKTTIIAFLLVLQRLDSISAPDASAAGEAPAPIRATAPNVVVYPAPAGETLSTDYEVRVEGLKVDAYRARVLDPPFAGKEWDYGGPYSFANLDMSGPVTVRITSPRSLRNVVIRPQSSGVRPVIVDDHTITLPLERPCKLSIEPDGRRGPLLLFANPPAKASKNATKLPVGLIPGCHADEIYLGFRNQVIEVGAKAGNSGTRAPMPPGIISSQSSPGRDDDPLGIVSLTRCSHNLRSAA